MIRASLMAGAGTLLWLGSFAQAGPVYNFAKIPSNDGAAEDLGSQLSVEVLSNADDPTHVGSTQVGFLFKNDVGIASNVTEIYFDDGSLLGISTIYNSGAGVTFSDAGNTAPGDVPGGSSIAPVFITSQEFSADTDGGAGKGINLSTEWSLIVFDLKASKTYADTISALALGAIHGEDPEALRIGLHVRAIGPNEKSNSYINTVSVVPVPPAVWMGMALLGGTGLIEFIRRRRCTDLF